MISSCRDPQIRQEDPKNHFSAVAGGAYDPSVVTGMPAWPAVQLLVVRELGEPVSGAGPLGPARRSGDDMGCPGAANPSPSSLAATRGNAGKCRPSGGMTIDG